MEPVVVVMGVAGSGKTTVGRLAAELLGVRFVDADDHHSPAARAKIAAGTPLCDEDRWPWLDRLHAVLATSAAGGVVLACSALREVYRRRLLDGIDGALLVFLDGDPALLRARLSERRGHFAGPELLDSQLVTLEQPADALRLDIAEPPDRLAAAIVRRARPDGGQR